MTTQMINTDMIQGWVADNLGIQEVEQKMQALQFDEQTKEAYLNQFKKERNSKRQFKGFVCLGLGAFLGFVSCVLTLINPVPELYNWILFGLTSVSVLVVFMGLYFLFE